MADFIQIVDSIFVNKQHYKNISDEDKITSFYKINKKFSIKYPDIAKFFNDHNIDKASSIDLWNLKFKKEKNIPSWYWAKSPFNANEHKLSIFSESDKRSLVEEFELSEHEFGFLKDNFSDELDYELKVLKRWNKNK